MKPRRGSLDSDLHLLHAASVAREAALAKIGSGRLDERETEEALRVAARSFGFESHREPPPSPDLVEVKIVHVERPLKATTDWIRRRGGEPDSVGTTVSLARLPQRSIGELAGLDWVRQVEHPRPLHSQLATARRMAGDLDAAVARLQSPQLSLDGEGVVVGIIDTGVDWRHPDFVAADGQSRIELFVHVRKGQVGPPYDTFRRDELTLALRDGGGVLPFGDQIGHGTHVASIAAGNGSASGGRLRGMAPASTLMVVRADAMSDNHVIWAIRELFRAAGARPAVLCMSFATQLGPHDGTTALEMEIDRACGPGRVIVIAAGNDGDRRAHWQGELVAGSDTVMSFTLRDRARQIIDVWIPRGDEIDAWVQSPDGARHPADDATPITTPSGTSTVDFREDPISRDRNLRLTIERGHAGEQWQVILRPSRIVHGVVHAWASTTDPHIGDIFPETSVRSHSLAIPATAGRAISVGAFVSRETLLDGGVGAAGAELPGALCPFSGQGPTRQDSRKPDIAAPGRYITAALASNSRFSLEGGAAISAATAPGYIAQEGTSMAAPVVAGVVALMLQRNPRLAPEEIRHRLRVTARRDVDTGRVWCPGFGYGKLDVSALLDYKD